MLGDDGIVVCASESGVADRAGVGVTLGRLGPGESIAVDPACAGFERDPVDAEGWSFLTRDNFRVMLGECPDERPAAELGNHSYFAYLYVDGVDQLYEEVVARGAEILSAPANKPWGLREFGLRTPDGHRLTCGEPVA